MGQFLRLPSLEGAKITWERMYDGDTTNQPTFTQVAGDNTRPPGAPDDVLPRFTSNQAKKTRVSSRISSAWKDASKKHKFMVVNELSKSSSKHSQQEKDDAWIDVTEDVAHSLAVSDPRDVGVAKTSVEVTGEGTSKQVASTSRGGSRPSPHMRFELEWEISPHDWYNTNSVCRDMLLQLSTPTEQDILASHEKLKEKYEEHHDKHEKLLGKHDGMYSRHQEKKKEYEARVLSLQQENEEYQRSHAYSQSLTYLAGYLIGLMVACSLEKYESLIADATHLDLDPPRTFEPVFEDLFAATYPYITHFSASYLSSVVELLDIHPKYAEPDSPSAD
ncbi:hypothetical protein Tco_0180114 [Tanacetum coccineum]